MKQVGVTALYVTHDQEEAFAIADRIVIFHARPELGEGGHVEQIAAPQELYRRPATAYVARFLGFRNLLPGRVIGPWPESTADGPDGRANGRQSAADGDAAVRVATALGELTAADLAGPHDRDAPVTVLIRPEAADVCAGADAPNVIAGRLVAASFRGSYALIRIEHAGGVTLTCEAPAERDMAIGAAITLRLDPRAVTLLPPQESNLRSMPI